MMDVGALSDRRRYAEGDKEEEEEDEVVEEEEEERGEGGGKSFLGLVSGCSLVILERDSNGVNGVRCWVFLWKASLR